MEKMDDGIKTNSSKKKEMTIFGIITVLVIAALLGGGYYFFSKPKAILKESMHYLTKGFREIEENKLAELFSENDQVKLEGKMNIAFNKDLELGLENIDFTVIAQEDKEAQVARYKIDADLDQKSLLGIDTYFSDNKMYIMMKDILDKYYFTEQEYISFLNTNDDENLEALMEIISKSTKKVIHDNRFKKESVTKEIDGKNEKVTKLSLDITDQLLSEWIQDIVKQVEDSDQAMAALEHLTGQEEAEIKAVLDEFSDAVKDTNGETLLTYNVYYKGMNEIRMLELTDGEDAIIYTANGDYHLEIKNQNEVILDLKITTENDVNKVNITAETIKVVGEIKEEDKLSTAAFKIYESETEIGIIKLSEKKIKDTESNLEMTLESNQMQIIKITWNSKFTFGEKIALEDLKDAKDINEMSVEEAQKMLENLQNHEFLGSFMDLLDMFGNEEDYDYDYDYDADFES